jgi:hypothetical protein
MAKIKITESKTIPEGRQDAEITASLRKVPGEKDDKGNPYQYDYTDYTIKLTGVEGEPEIKMGFPTDVKVDQNGNPTTKHAKFLKSLGLDLQGEIDTDSVVGKKVSVLIQNHETERGVFARVAEGSVKPL